MPDSTTSSERSIDATGFALVTGAQSEQALRSAIQRLERIGDSPLDLAQALVKLGALRQEKGSHSEAEELFRRALDISESTLGSEHIEMVQALTSLGSARILLGSPETAEPLFNRALSISTRYLGEDHPDLVIMVNDIARLYLKHGAYSFAEPLLQRLLSMKRSKGDDHPEVATVLASLAAVHQARGQHESAEDLWRRVLAIRDRTLAPNHFAQATALEHLADVCAARGKVGEALQLFQRAQTIREMTLGVDHSSLRISRERIADLQLQASDDSFDDHHIRTPGQQPDDVGRVDTLGINTPVARRPARETTRRTRTMPFVEPELSRPLPPNDREAPPTTRVRPAEDAEEREAAALAYRAALLEERQDAYEDEEKAIGLVKGIFASGIAFARKHQAEVLAVAGVMAFLLIALAASTRVSGEVDQPIIEPSSVATVSSPAIPQHSLPSTGNQLKEAAPIIAPPTPEALRPRTPELRVPEKVSNRKAQPPRISIPTVSSPMTNRFDSLVTAAGAPSRIGNETIPAPSAEFSTSISHPSFGNGESATPQSTRARLIGSLPVPRYPTQISEVEGEVIVRFTVDTAGRPEMGTLSVVKSPYEFLTTAVRKDVQGMRFEPARSDTKRIADVVEIRYLFSPTAK